LILRGIFFFNLFAPLNSLKLECIFPSKASYNCCPPGIHVTWLPLPACANLFTAVAVVITWMGLCALLPCKMSSEGLAHDAALKGKLTVYSEDKEAEHWGIRFLFVK
jgi:hypothetical protein